jgi:hypothetical protein
MTTFIEKIAVEIVISLCVGAVLGVISGLLPSPDEAVRHNRRVVCHRRGSDELIEAGPDQVGAGDEHQ